MPIDYSHEGTHRPSPDVHTFLGRPGPARSARTLTDYLAPRPAPAAPTRPAGARPGPAPRSPGSRPPAGPVRKPPVQQAPPVQPTPVHEAPPVAEAVVGAPRPSERRTVLDEDHPSVTLWASERSGGTVHAVLTWQPRLSAAGVRLSTDVHLGCLWELRDGPAGIVQELGGTFSAPGFGSRQVLRLGPRSEEAGEELLLDLRHVDVLRRMVLFATGRRGAPDWASLQAILSLRLPTGERLETALEPPGSPAASCAVVSVHNVGGDLVLRRELEYLDGPQRAVAEAYGWDLDFDAEGTVPRVATR
ncbi:tellurite resistance protein TerA [Kineococcus xinjiangensis]|uniref:Tellurite resistance protein TerA n=1 Tax=Kineococcus xinjiangensis TaxID=512762 RepID=A0A2S6IMI1_9ACTN|nr:hypothetical protein [Kineococcus xinjiangensis]PPK95365.1 tellurite resistance protein TerA [Kineococcus xinjiangensis]